MGTRQTIELADSHVCVIGLGYVGLTLAVALADVGFNVVGVEIRAEVVDRLKNGDAHFFEPGLNSRLKRLQQLGRLEITQNVSVAAYNRVFIVTVGTPLDNDGKARLDMISASAREIARHMIEGDMIVMRSTVRLGTTRDVVMPILDSVGLSYDIAFCPERTVEGQALAELRTLPQIVGAATQHASIRAAHFFNMLTPTIVKVGSLEVAEMTKLIDNTYRDITFAFANEVARLCDSIGVSAHAVITAGKLGYPRTSLPLPGPVGGPCLNKDTHILAESFSQHGLRPEIALTARGVNEAQPADLANRLAKYIANIATWPAEPIITVLGFAFKGRPITDDLRGTMAEPLLSALRQKFPSGQFRGWDAMVSAEALSQHYGVVAPATLDEAIDRTNLVIIANNHPRFQELSMDEFAQRVSRPALIYDLWNHFVSTDLELPVGIEYIALGDGQLSI